MIYQTMQNLTNVLFDNPTSILVIILIIQNFTFVEIVENKWNVFSFATYESFEIKTLQNMYFDFTTAMCYLKCKISGSLSQRNCCASMQSI